jgi:ABC-type Fe3+-hydroxamate transport system substrate-binding protein
MFRNPSPSARMGPVLVMASVALALAGCSMGAETTSPSQSPSPTVQSSTPTPTATASATAEPVPSAPAEPLALEELHQLYVASGLPCDWVLTEAVTQGSSESGVCLSTEVGISTFPSQADVEALLQLNLDSIEPGIFLVGDRWVVGSEHPEDLIQAQITMGGELWPADSPFYPAE